MGLFDRIRASMHGDRDVSPEHLEGYKRLANEVYDVEVELAHVDSARARAYLNLAKCFQVMGEALLRDAFPTSGGHGNAVPLVTQEQAAVWYEQIPELLIAVRQEAAFEGRGRLALPLSIGRRVEFRDCPTSHLAGMRRATNEVESTFSDSLRHAQLEKDRYQEVLLMYEEARTRRQLADAILGSIMDGKKVPLQTHEEAEDHYWQALSNYVLIVQGLASPDIFAHSSAPYQSRRSKLDSEDPWRVTSRFAVEEIRAAGDYWSAQDELIAHWQNHFITDEERAFQATAEELLARGDVVEEGFWFTCPFPSVYRVVKGPIWIVNQQVPQGYFFTWDYGEHGQPGRLICERNFDHAEGPEI